MFLDKVVSYKSWKIPFGADKLTTAGPTLAAALAIVSRPRQLQECLGPPPATEEVSLLISDDDDGSALVLETKNGNLPTLYDITYQLSWIKPTGHR